MPFIETTDIRWKKLLQNVSHDFYHLPDYALLESKVINGKSLAWYTNINGNELLIPLVERVIKSNGVVEKDLVSPYGYSGILYNEIMPFEIYNESISRYHNEAASIGYVSSFIRLHPLLNNYRMQKQQGVTQHFHGSTISVNLSLPIQDVRQSYSINHKRNLKKLHREEFFSKVNDWDKYKQFIDLYLETMKRKNAGKRYFFSNDYFYDLRKILGDNLILIIIYDNRGVPASSGLFTVVNGLAQFHLGGTSSYYLDKSPSKLMIDCAISACKSMGATTLHLGGGYGSNTSDGLYRFKAGFGSKNHNFSTLRFIHNKEKYYNLMNSVGIEKDSISFFPEYRFLKN